MATFSAARPAMRSTYAHHAHPMDSSQMLRVLLTLLRDNNLEAGSREVIFLPTLRRLLSALHFRDAETLKHSRRVALISVGIAARLGWEQEELRIIEVASLLHDIGKIGVPDHIFRKPGKLSPDEAEFIAVHHRVAVSLLQACQIHPEITEIISQAHGVQPESINSRRTSGLGARILAVADAYDSLTTEQCFRTHYSQREALEILEEQAGRQFDRNVIAALSRWLNDPDSSVLADEQAAEVSIQVNAPVDAETRANSGILCALFNHLYLLESLYDAFYVVDANRRIVIWSSGAVHLLGRSASDVLRSDWSRNLITQAAVEIDPLELSFLTGEAHCLEITIQDSRSTLLDVDLQSFPIHSEDGQVIGVAEMLCNGKESKQNRGQFRSLQIAATRDPLTGVYNRGKLESSLQNMYDIWKADPSKLFSVVFLDLDHFKSINDRLSHAVGDRVLIDVAHLLQDDLYSGELVGRYGGEEFVILCPETEMDMAIERAERLRRAIMSHRFAERDDLRVTASLGVAQIRRGDKIETVMGRADEALYEAKRLGRNRTCFRDVHDQPAVQEKRRHKSQAELTHSATLLTSVATDLLPLKLGGFVDERKAKILHVGEDQVRLQIGEKSLFSRWTMNQSQIPVQVTLDIEQAPMAGQTVRIHRLKITATVEPLTRHVKPEIFRIFASQLIEELRSYLLAD